MHGGSDITATMAVLRHVPLVALDPAGRVVAISEAGERLLGTRGEPVVGRGLEELCSDPPERIRALVAECARTLAPIPAAFERVVGGVPTRFRCDGYATLLPDGGGRIVTLLLRRHDEQDNFILLGQKVQALNHEVLLRRQRERELADARRRLAAILEQLPSGVVIAAAPAGNVVYSNRRAREVFSGSFEVEDAGEYPTAFAAWHEDGRPFELEEFPLVRALRGESLAGLEMHFESAAGQMEVVRVNAGPIKDEAGTIVAAVAAFYDVTEQKQLERTALAARAEAEAASRAKDEFLAMLGHELRNPLAPILTALQLMELRGSGTDKERRIIRRQVDHMVRLVEDLLDVSRIARGKVELKREHVELAAVLSRAVEMAGPALEGRSIDLSVAVSPPELGVDADPARLSQVLFNLLHNAAKYSDPGGRVEVSARREDGQVVVAVRDQGIGIAPPMLSAIFELFTQQAQTSERSQGGLGLGLAIARSLIELHGGGISAQSDGVGRGSTFTVRLPAAPRDSQAALPRPAEALSHRAGPGAGTRVLIVDDNQDSAETLGEILTDLGYEVRVVVDPVTALRIGPPFAPQIALLDIGLPVMDGYELGRLLRDQHGLPELRLVAVTGYGQASDRSRSQAAGFHAHLVKPIDVARLDALLRELVTAGSTLA